MTATQQAPEEEQDMYDLGLQADLAMWTRSPIERRQILKLGAVGIGVLLAGVGANAGTLSAAEAAANAAAACVTEIPQETNGPYPADGSQASSQVLNALTLSGIVRRDIRTSLGTGKTAPGIPTTIELTLISTEGDCAPLSGYAVYIWHCDRDGNYSLYSNGVTGEDYLRGVQQSDSNGKLSFTTIFPACYSGRWPHVHFEIYPSLAKATASSNSLHISQLAVPKEICDTVYATPGYEQSVRNLSQITLATDNVFSDGYSTQLATVTGDVTNGYVLSLTVGVNPAGTSNPGGGGAAPPGGGPGGGPGGSAPPSGAPMPPGGGTAPPSASASPRPSTSAVPSASPSAAPSTMPGLPNTGGGGTGDSERSWLVAAPLVAAAALLAPLARRFRRR